MVILILLIGLQHHDLAPGQWRFAPQTNAAATTDHRTHEERAASSQMRAVSCGQQRFTCMPKAPPMTGDLPGHAEAIQRHDGQFRKIGAAGITPAVPVRSIAARAARAPPLA
jgi:hypothetical protein